MYAFIVCLFVVGVFLAVGGAPVAVSGALFLPCWRGRWLARRARRRGWVKATNLIVQALPPTSETSARRDLPPARFAREGAKEPGVGRR